jgi:hypothetical protein
MNGTATSETLSLVPPTVPWEQSERALTMMQSLLHREMTGKITPRSAQMVMARLLPPINPVNVVPPINLTDIPTPTTPTAYRSALRQIYRAAVDGQCSLDDARKAMILTKTLWRAELETALLESKKA